MEVFPYWYELGLQDYFNPLWHYIRTAPRPPMQGPFPSGSGGGNPSRLNFCPHPK